MKRLKILLILIIMCFSLPAFAALDLELTQGVNAALPIAIVPFANQEANVPGNQTLTQVITHDLQNSGQFRVKGQGVMSQHPTSIDQLDTAYWRKRGVDDVLMGQVTKMGGDQYRVAFQLVSTVDTNANGNAKPSAATAANKVLLNASFDTPQIGLRQLAHHISDMIYEKLTGVRGVFSTKIAYVLVQRRRHKATKYTLEISDIDGFDPRALLVSPQPIMSPTWSPDGRQLAYVSFEGRHASIFLQDIASGQRQLATNYPGINGAPAFSPDGKQLALVLTLTGNPKIYTFNLVTKKLTRITNGYSIDTEPAWAPDGESLLFTSNRGGSPQVYRYYFQNGQVNRLTFDGNYNARASFMPQEQNIVMVHRNTGLFGIAREDLNSGQTQMLVQTGADESPSLSPNGEMVIYATQYGGRGVLALVSTDGRIKLRLPAREGDVREPAWSPYLN